MTTPSQMLTQEKLAMYREAFVYHSGKRDEDKTSQEVAWLQWVPGRIKELEAEQ